MIGANMSVRRDVLMSWGGFQSDNHDDMDLSHRAIHAHGTNSVIYDPSAIVHHFVPTARLTWTYFGAAASSSTEGRSRRSAGLDEASESQSRVSFCPSITGARCAL